MVIYITFSFPKFKVRFCDGEDRPGEDGSDYEIWEPSGKITKECLMGHSIEFVRRKREAKCFNKY